MCFLLTQFKRDLFLSQITGLLKTLNQEISDNKHYSDFIEELVMFISPRNMDEQDIRGLQNKLNHVDRGAEYTDAIMKKEAFAKLFKKLEHFQSAQRIFSHFLSIIHEVFDAEVMHRPNPLSRDEVERIVSEKIVQPILDDMGDGCEHFTINPTTIKGMIFWLADKCWVRWH